MVYCKIVLCKILLISTLSSVLYAEERHDLIIPQAPLLLLSTLNGTIIAVKSNSGEEVWRIQEDPIISLLNAANYGYKFLPNPRDGSIYSVGSNGNQLERLPLTIPELVRASPTLGSDGLLYAAHKSDMWIAIDPVSGTKLHTYTGSGDSSSTCSLADVSGSVLYIARTAYTVTVYDSITNSKKWNVTYLEYASNSFANAAFQGSNFSETASGTNATPINEINSSYTTPININDQTFLISCSSTYTPHLVLLDSSYMPQCGYSFWTVPAVCDLLYFSSNSDGSVLSVDRLTGHPIWRKSYGSPVVNIYAVEEGSLRKIPMISVASETLKFLTESSALAIGMDVGLKPAESVLQPSLFIGSYQGQIYALDSLVNEENMKLEFYPGVQTPHVPLLDGPLKDDIIFQTQKQQSPHNIQVLSHPIDTGHYCLPEEAEVHFNPTSKKVEQEFLSFLKHGMCKFPSDSLLEEDKNQLTDIGPSSVHTSSLASPSPLTDILIPALTVFVSSIIAAVIAVLVTKFAIQRSISGTSMSTSRMSISTGSVSSTSSHISLVDTRPINVTTPARDQSGNITIGKITYCAHEVLGHGSEGTIVFKGVFDQRAVAVKRILPECFELADREVELLRLSDEHPNVVRYFCMEQDVSFRYIALELCQVTLHEYVEDNQFNKTKIDAVTVLHQAMKGLAFLHSIGIIHRDIKPRNVLLSFPSSSGQVRAMISDFGLCRKLPIGKVSITAKSGVAGTEGWMAPEIFDKSKRVTCAVDIFSFGCVMYYVLTSGQHPFGSSLRRQANIETAEYSLNELTGIDKYVATGVIKDMISNNSRFRPSSCEVVSHCFFWSKTRRLAFFQDVSDRIEKEPFTSPIVQALEQGGLNVVRRDWREYITEDLKEDLRKFRAYHGSSVRDLLRAMRNKKHHYRELPEGLKKSLGVLPDEFVDYFLTRFPLLLIHTYKHMEICKHEPIFQHYYSSDLK